MKVNPACSEGVRARIRAGEGGKEQASEQKNRYNREEEGGRCENRCAGRRGSARRRYNEGVDLDTTASSDSWELRSTFYTRVPG
eukprot:1235723-Pleurochrysis_carterae.AAC.1